MGSPTVLFGYVQFYMFATHLHGYKGEADAQKNLELMGKSQG